MPLLPGPIERFLRSHIAAVDHLDLLVLLFNSPETEWTAAAAAQVVHCPADKAGLYLDQLQQHGFLAVTAGSPVRYAYRPKADVAQSAQAMVDFYRERPVSVIRRIYDLPQDPVNAFAAAFKIRKEE